MEREEGRGRRRGKLREGRAIPGNRPGAPLQQPFLEQVIACGLKAFHPRLLEVEPQPQSPAKRTCMALLGGGVERGGESFPIVLGFQHFNLLLALFNLSLNYCLLSMLVANMYLFIVHFDFSDFFPSPFSISVLFIPLRYDQGFF